MSATNTMSGSEVEEFLHTNKSPLKLGTLDRFGDAIIHPLWYVYQHGKFYILTATDSKKLENVRRKNRVYFCVDTETRPYRGVKGKGTPKTVQNDTKAIEIGEKIITKYLGSVDNSLGKSLIPRLKSGKESLLEITPIYFSVWDDSKSP